MAAPLVRYYTSLMPNAPQLTNAWGDLTTMLDAVLVNGFNSKTITLTSTGGVATATSAAHGFVVDQVVNVAGASDALYNGDVVVTTATTNTFTYAITGSPATPTGTITAKIAPLGFTIAFTGTNKRAYRSANALSNKPYLRVDNSLDANYTTTYAKKAKVTMAEGMTDIDTFVGARAPFVAANPTLNEVSSGTGATVIDGWYKWYYARTEANVADTTVPGTGNRSWVIVGDDRGFYFFTEHGITNTGRTCYAFTDFTSYRAGDGYNTVLAAAEMGVTASVTPSTVTTTSSAGADLGGSINQQSAPFGKVLMRDHLGVGGTTRFYVSSLNVGVASGYTTTIPWPNGPDYSLVLHPMYIQHETTGHMRGVLPGVMWVCNTQPLSDLTVLDNVAGYTGRKFLIVQNAYNTASAIGNVSRLAFDITGPWY